MYTDDPPPYTMDTSDTLDASNDSDPSTESSEVSSTQGTTFTSLSTELVAEILLYVCSPTQNEDDQLHLEPRQRWVRKKHPLALGSVCKLWREYIWSTSEFWTTIILRVAQDQSHFPVDMFQEWLNRAKGRPLDIFVYCPPSPSQRRNRAYMKQVLSVLSVLAQCSKQWRRIEAHIPLMWAEHLFMDQGPSSLPLLQQAVISYKMDHLPYVDESHLPCFTQAKALRHLSLCNSIVAHNELLYRINTRCITTLTFYGVNTIPIHLLLNRFPQLTTLTILKSPVTFAAITTKEVHNKIQTLTIDFMGHSRSLEDFLRPFVFPNLKSLTIHSHSGLLYTRYIRSFLKVSGCGLTKLSLICPIDMRYEYDLIELLSDDSIFLSLQELYITDYTYELQGGAPDMLKPFDSGIGRTFFENFHPDQDPNYLPELQVFEYSGPLAVPGIDFLEPLVIRSKIRDRLRSSGEFLATRSYFDSKMATVRKVVIKGDQYSEMADFTISEFSDPQYIWEIISLMEEEVFSLRNRNGSLWM